MTRRPWTSTDLAVLRAEYAETPTQELADRLGRALRAVYDKAKQEGLKKSPHYFARGLGGRTGDGRGAATRFKPGQPGWNKGQRYQPGGACKDTQFKPGATPHNWVPVGAYRINAEGYLDRKICEERGARNWEGVHRLVWKETHGEIPAGCSVVFLPSRRTNVLEEITLDALELVTRGELMRRNTIHRYPPELKQTMKLVARVKRIIKERADEEQTAGSA